MLNFTPAKVTPGDAVAEVDAAQAAMRPLAGFGAGAFTCDGAWVGSRAGEMAASRALRRRRGAFGAIGLGHAHAGGSYQPNIARTSVAGISTARISTARISTVGSSGAGTVYTKQPNLMTRLYLATPGGVGPHPAREPDPV